MQIINSIKDGILYNKEEELLVELLEYGDNQLLIKSKSLQPISNKIEVDIAKDAPLFIQKFFDNQQITENYYENLNRYI